MNTRTIIPCSQTDCDFPATHRYNWPAKGTMHICGEHLPKLRAIAEAVGLSVESLDLRALVGMNAPPLAKFPTLTRDILASVSIKDKYHRALLALVALHSAAEKDGDTRLAESANAAVVNLLRGLPTGDREELADEAQRFGHTLMGIGR
jgi:hypothetical protein